MLFYQVCEGGRWRMPSMIIIFNNLMAPRYPLLVYLRCDSGEGGGIQLVEREVVIIVILETLSSLKKWIARVLQAVSETH